MYEVYNNKIFDLLIGTATKASKTPAHQLRRRELLFKSTEYSPDRKIVAGLRKIVCGNLDEALQVLETGLTERRVASTGSNAVSSRSHGFFNVEVKKRSKAGLSDWNSSTMTIVDLAGSERARDAKTAGATLAEAGKINESLMYLGQCMQMQSDNSIAAADLSTLNPKLVPFRQCKLTELLFSNSFKTSPTARSYQPQKAVMIVTADPHGDFNATSQILRYSALAREVTVPRIPSVTSTIGLTLASGSTSRPTTADGSKERNPPAVIRSYSGADSAYSSLEQQLDEETAVLRIELAEEIRRRRCAEESWARTEQEKEELEAEVRAECFEAFETRLAAEQQRWLAAHEEQAQRTQNHLDTKLDLLARGLDEVVIHEDDKDEIITRLERENADLRERLRNMEREKDTMRSPSKKLKPLKGKKWDVGLDGNELTNDENVF
ncbi:hypothetical protein FH972_021944 [Carpinus fangiana]|uniref:Kinesin-like protein n=1 Tax=Carpinus fangiana TaxID=176857 RepID=A0A5N6KQT4_9ROSI|nr:hypothetical protein FH972_021944 [Carpinus fangiana]